MAKLPNFFIIGAPKSGTTSLYAYLKQHPQVFMPAIKEPNFFSQSLAEVRSPEWRHIKELSEYEKLFNDVKDEQAIGEGSISYFACPQAPAMIYQYIPKAKLIAILRNPADRAYSAYTFSIQGGSENNRNFAQALKAEEEKIPVNRFYKNVGFYATHLQRFYQQFPKEQIKIFLYEDLKNNRQQLLKDLYNFLEVDPNFTPKMDQQFNVTRKPKSRLLNNFLSKSNPLRNLLIKITPDKVRNMLNLYQRNLAGSKFPPIPEKIKIELLTEYRESILQLQDMINRDLSDWLKPLQK